MLAAIKKPAPLNVVAGRARLAILAAAWAVFVLAVYCPDVGRGFVKDDFTWIRAAKGAIAQPADLIVPREPGFYRPLVTASFALDYASHRWQPRGYGWTNVALYVACTAAVGILALAIGLSEYAAIMAAFLWAVNPHGINMAVLWLSGRTALCLTLFSVLAASAFARRRFGWGAVAIALALASKEEAVVLPFVLLAWTWMLDDRHRIPARAVIAAVLPLAVYGVFRTMTPAFTPAKAPSFYRFATDPIVLIRNVTAYLDRSATLVIAATLLVLAIGDRWFESDTTLKRIVRLSAVWWAGMLAITVWLPVRSSLYAVCPSVGSALVGAVLIEQVRRRTSDMRRSLVEPALAATLVLTIPIYQIRNDAWVEGARVSQRTLVAIRSNADALPTRGRIVLADDPGATVSNFRNAFGDLTTEALQTAFNRQWDASIVDDDSAPSQDVIARYQLDRGRIVATVPPQYATPR